jgi:hypothetical protein
MSSDRDLTHIVRSWLDDGANVLSDRVLDEVLAQLPVIPQRRGPIWRAWRKQIMNGTTKLAAAGAFALAVAAVATALYFSRPAVVPAGSPKPRHSPLATVAGPSQPTVAPPAGSPTSPAATTQPTRTGSKPPWVVFLRGAGGTVPNDLWAMRVDGSDAQEILPGLSFYSNIAWSQNGRRLLVTDIDPTGTSHVYLADVSDVIGPFVDTGFGTGAETACLEKSGEPYPCQDWAISFAPDGERVVILQTCTIDGMFAPRWNDGAANPPCTFLTILDLRTGEPAELSETVQRGGDTELRGWNSNPAWSVDGSMIAFVRATGSSGADSNLYLINADGTNLHMVDLPVSRVAAPQWSPDGTTLVFAADTDYYLNPRNGWLEHSEDIYTAHADGTGLRQLTSNGVSFSPEWTLLGDIRFRDSLHSETYMLMDADGGTLRHYADLESLVRALPPSGSSGEYSTPGYPSWQQVHWQPTSWQPTE